MKLSKLLRGHSLYICFDGDYHGFFIEWGELSKRVLLGFVSIGWVKVDVEKLIDVTHDMAVELKKLKEENNEPS